MPTKIKFYAMHDLLYVFHKIFDHTLYRFWDQVQIQVQVKFIHNMPVI